MSVCPVDPWALSSHVRVADSCCPAGTALPLLHKCLTPLGPQPLPSCRRAPPVLPLPRTSSVHAGCPRPKCFSYTTYFPFVQTLLSDASRPTSQEGSSQDCLCRICGL